MKKLYNMIGGKIRIIRTLKGYSQDYVAEKLKISQPTYSDIENNKTKLSFDLIEKIAILFEIETTDLINFDGKKVFNNTFSENAKGFFSVKNFFNKSFENERQSYKEQIANLKEEIVFLRNHININKKKP